MRHTSTTVEAVGALQSTCYQQKKLLFSFNDWNVLPSNNLLIEKLSYRRHTTRRVSRSVKVPNDRYVRYDFLLLCCSSFVVALSLRDVGLDLETRVLSHSRSSDRQTDTVTVCSG